VNLVSIHGKKWSVIQAKLNRSADSCRDKYREMDDSFIRGRWKEEETEQLKKLIRQHLNAHPQADIKEIGKMVEAEGIKIQWQLISKQMGKRSRLSCFKKWQKMTGLFSPSDHPNATAHDIYNRQISNLSEMEDTPVEEDSAEAEKSEEESRTKSEHSLPDTHAAPTAGAAAALAATRVNDPIGHSIEDHVLKSDLGDDHGSSATAMGVNNPIGQPVEDNEHDLILLGELVNSGGYSSSDVNWEDLTVENALERWRELLEAFQDANPPDSVLALPLWKLAQHILDRKTSAQRAAETVEAVDLPPPESLQTQKV